MNVAERQNQVGRPQSDGRQGHGVGLRLLGVLHHRPAAKRLDAGHALRAIVIGPIARLELIPKDDSRPAGGPLVESLIEAQLPAQQFRELGLKEGDTVVLTPRKARVFVDAGEGI